MHCSLSLYLSLSLSLSLSLFLSLPPFLSIWQLHPTVLGMMSNAPPPPLLPLPENSNSPLTYKAEGIDIVGVAALGESTQ